MTFVFIKTTPNRGGKVKSLWITLWKLGISQKVLYMRVIFENSKFVENYLKIKKSTELVNNFMLISQRHKKPIIC